MSKQITIPYGYNVSDSDVGTLSLITGRNYNLTDVKMEDVNLAVFGGRSTPPYNLESLSISANVNNWAAFKPHTNTNFPSGMKVISQEMSWDKPTENYRLADFGGYNSTPTIPNRSPATDNFDYSAFQSFTQVTRSITLTLPEFDITNDIEGGTAIDRVWTRTFRDFGFGFGFNLSTSTIITVSSMINKSLTVNYRLDLTDTSFNFRVDIWLGSSSNQFICRWFPFQTTGTATFFFRI